MSWLHSFFIAILTALLAAVVAGFIGAGCVEWYHISSREGGSFLFILALGFFSGIAVFVAALVASRFLGPGFLTGFGICAGATLAVAGIAALTAYGLADIPPTLNGHSLILEVEYRLPKGAPDPSASANGKEFFELFTRNAWSHTARKSKRGVLMIAETRQEEGRWIVPGSVDIFTTRGTRGFAVSLGLGQAIGFQLDFPGHPGPQDLGWTLWLPKSKNGNPWPDTEPSYRFRIAEYIPPPPPPDPSVVAEAEFAALTPDAPLEKWLSYLKYGMAADREQAIMKVVEARPTDLAKKLRSPNSGEVDTAIYAVSRLKVVAPEVSKAVLEIAADIEDQIRKFNTMKPDQPGYYELGNDIRNRFKSWSQAWWTVHRVTGVDGRPPLDEILRLASVQKESGHMQEVVLDAEAHLGGMTSAAK